ncbi:MAG: radical SAM/SPASM domain-containing protein, partial [Thermoanaerobaculia bacterium]
CALNDREFRKSRAGEMPLSRALELVRQMRGVKVLLLYGLGEPLLYKGLEEVIREARRRIPTVSFTTNATLLTGERSRSLAAAGLSRIQVSLDSLDPEYHRRVRGGELPAILENVERFSRVTGLPVHLWAVVTAENVRRLHEVVELKARIPTLEHAHFQLLDGEHLRAKHNLEGRIPREVMVPFKRRLYRRCRELGLSTDVDLLPDEPPSGYSRGICPAPWTGVAHIDYAGHVNPCCVMPEVALDSAVELGFRRAWNGPQMRRLRREILEGSYLPSCQNSCGFLCNGRSSFQAQNRREWTPPIAEIPVLPPSSAP